MFAIVKSQRGSVVTLTALAMTVLIGFAAIVVDLGILYVNRTQLVNLADAAALAGVQELPRNPVDAELHASVYARYNGKAGDVVLPTTAGTNNKLIVDTRRNVALFFARIFNWRSSTVEASATAAIRPIKAVTGTMPFGVVKQDFQFGKTYTLKEGAGDGYSGNYGALALGGSGASSYRDNIMSAYSGKLQIGQRVPTETGNMSSPTRDGVQYRLSQDAGSSFDTAAKGSPRIVVIPVIDSLDVSGRSDVLIVGFAAFYLEGVGGSGNDNYVTGKFMQLVVTGDVTGEGTSDFGLYGATLVK